MICAAAVALLLFGQTDEDEATKVCERYFAAMKKGDFTAGADCMHPKSLQKMRDSLVKSAQNESDKVKNTVAANAGFKSWDEMRKSSGRDFFIRYCTHLRELGESTVEEEARVVGAMKKEDRLYVVVEVTAKSGDEKVTLTVLHVLYKDGAQWKLASRNEANVGK